MLTSSIVGTSKHYSGYELTNLGFQMNFQVGEDYRAIYVSSKSPKKILGISENKHTPAQVFASAPDQSVLLNTATAFLQGKRFSCLGVSVFRCFDQAY